MSVLQATSYHLIEILYLLKVCFHGRNSTCLLRWDLQFDIINADINKGNIYLYRKNGVTLGMVTLELEPNSEFKNISYASRSLNPLLAHRLAVHPNWKNQGIENKILQFIEQFAHLKGYTSIRIDAYAENTEAIDTYNKFHYLETGQIQFHYQKVPYTCFEKLI